MMLRGKYFHNTQCLINWKSEDRQEIPPLLVWRMIFNTFISPPLDIFLTSEKFLYCFNVNPFPKPVKCMQTSECFIDWWFIFSNTYKMKIQFFCFSKAENPSKGKFHISIIFFRECTFCYDENKMNVTEKCFLKYNAISF